MKLLAAKNMTKSYGTTKVLQNVTLELERGEVKGLIGENGSGKSTISSIIAGINKADSGEVYFKDKLFTPSNSIDALNNGVGMIVQECGTIPGITVAENIFLGESKKFRNKAGIINKKLMVEGAKKALEKIGANHIHAEMITGAINFQDRKLIEIARIMYKNPEVLIVDETTTALSQRGRQIVYKIIDDMKDEGKSVIFISHDLEEIMEVCDTLTVLRDGIFIRNLSKSEFDEDTIKQLMVGRELTGNYYRSDFDSFDEKDVVLEARNLVVKDELSDISFDLHRGEILGIGGLSECGMHTIGRCLFGYKKLYSGSVSVGGKKVLNERSAINLGIGYVSKDRDTESLNVTANIKDNLSICGLDKIAKGGFFISSSAEKKYTGSVVQSLRIKCRSENQLVSELSGGNKQKIAFGKWTASGSQILVLDCPTRGVDIGVKQAMYQLIYDLKKQGASIVIISEELSELIGMSDTLLVIKEGKLSKTFKRSASLTESEIIKYMI